MRYAQCLLFTCIFMRNNLCTPWNTLVKRVLVSQWFIRLLLLDPFFIFTSLRHRQLHVQTHTVLVFFHSLCVSLVYSFAFPQFSCGHETSSHRIHFPFTCTHRSNARKSLFILMCSIVQLLTLPLSHFTLSCVAFLLWLSDSMAQKRP